MSCKLEPKNGAFSMSDLCFEPFLVSLRWRRCVIYGAPSKTPVENWQQSQFLIFVWSLTKVGKIRWMIQTFSFSCLFSLNLDLAQITRCHVGVCLSLCPPQGRCQTFQNEGEAIQGRAALLTGGLNLPCPPLATPLPPKLSLFQCTVYM